MAVKTTKTKRAAAVEQVEQEVREKVKTMSFEGATKELAGAQVEIQKTLADLSGRLAEQFQKLESVQEAIRLEYEELERLHEIKAQAITLEEIQAEVARKREEWQKEQDVWKRDFAEQKNQEQKNKAREDADYMYSLEQKRRKLEDTMNWEHQQKLKANGEKQEQLEKNWAERETLLKKSEQELAELRAFKEQYKEMVQKEVNAAVAVATNSVKKDYEHKAQMSQKDAESDKRAAEMEISSLKQQLGELKSQIVDLKSEVAEAHRRSAETAAKALESASERATSQAMQRLLEGEKMAGKTAK